MLLTVANKALATTRVESLPQKPAKGAPFPEAIRKRILNSTVMLKGSGRQARQGLFTGSGVIFKVDVTTVYLVTAAHNAQLWSGTPPGDWKNYLSGGQNTFARKVSIYYGNGDLSWESEATKSAAIKTIAIPAPAGTCGQEADCLYDLMVITSTDAAFVTFAKDRVFGGQSVDDIKKAVEREGKAVIKTPDAFLDSKKYYFVQLGHGEVEEIREKQWLDEAKKIKKQTLDKVTCENGTNMTKGKLHYRLTDPNFKQIKELYEQEADEGEDPAYGKTSNVIALSASKSSSTAPGDSGGPLYAVDKSYTGAYLLGVTCGADLMAAKTPSTAFKNCVSTSVVPYWKTIFA
ncbi:MAG: hypothetical protein ABI596_03470 [Pyrinomonadaceae bacterium]